MQFAIIARDGSDKEALSRRLQARDAHLQGAHSLKKQGHILEAGAMLNDQGGMVGSVILCDFPSREALDQWLKAEVYVTKGVWQHIDIIPIRLLSWQN